MNFDHDQKMYNIGYRYCCEPTKKEFEPLYVKALHFIGPLFRSYPETMFNVRKIVNDVKLTELFQLWANSKQSTVIDILAEDHPALVALFIAQGIADKVLTRGDINTIANLLSDKRVNLFLDNNKLTPACEVSTSTSTSTSI